MKFALVERGRAAPAPVATVEVILASGERLRIAPGIEAATLRLVLSVLRALPCLILFGEGCHRAYDKHSSRTAH
jgi:hypothetical protein